VRKTDNTQGLPVVKEVLLNSPVSTVWKAIADKDEMKKWYFDLSEFKPVLGFQFQFEGGTEEKTYLHLCEITEVIKFKKLSYSWRYQGFPGNSHVIIELFTEGNKTRLKLTHKGLESFGNDNPDFDRKNFDAGWSEIIGVSLKNYLENK
jgi:uncharacterized protein YndB with AHSA1/START domain